MTDMIGWTKCKESSIVEIIRIIVLIYEAE